jgi:hypothetical protein
MVPMVAATANEVQRIFCLFFRVCRRLRAISAKIEDYNHCCMYLKSIVGERKLSNTSLKIIKQESAYKILQ